MKIKLKLKGSNDVVEVEAENKGKEHFAICPWHKDSKPSLAINLNKGVFYCHGCRVSGIVVNEPTEDGIEDIYEYKDINGDLLYQVVRLKGKDFRARKTDNKGGWVWKLENTKKVLYNLPEVVKNENRRVFIVEGEKDANTLNKLGYTATCNPFGAGKWLDEYDGYLIGKDVIVIADNDKEGLKHAEDICNRLLHKANTVKLIIKMPFGKDVTEYLESKGTRETLDEVLSNAPLFEEKEEKGIKDVKIIKGENKDLSADEILSNADSRIEINPAIDYIDNVLYIGARFNKEVLWVTSERKILSKADMAKTFTMNSVPLKTKIQTNTIRAFKNKKDFVPVDELYDGILNIFQSHVIFKYSWQPHLLTTYTIATYLHPVFFYFPYLHATSMTKRCAKSIVEKILSRLCFNATQVLVNPTEATIYREINANSSTFIIDEVESLGEWDKDSSQAIKSIFNAGFEKGAIIPRVNTDTFTNEYLGVYGPKVFAGLKDLSSTISDRAIKIELLRKKGSEKVKRLDVRKMDSDFARLREWMYWFVLNYAHLIAISYEYGETLSIIKELDDRAKDIMEPLFATAIIIDYFTNRTTTTENLIDASKSISKTRGETDTTYDYIIKAVHILADKFKEDQNANKEKLIINGFDAQVLFQNGGMDWIVDNRKAANLLKKMGFYNGTHRVEGKVVRGFKVEKAKIQDLVDRYPVDVSVVEGGDVTGVTIEKDK